MAKAIINIYLDKKCARCGKSGATQNGLCMSCLIKAVRVGEFDHIIKKHRLKKETVR